MVSSGELTLLAATSRYAFCAASVVPIRAIWARIVGSSARLPPRCSNRAVPTCLTAAPVAAVAKPSETAAFPRLNQGSTVCIMMPNPPPASPRRYESGMRMSTAIGAEAFPRRPIPVKVPATRRPGVSAGTA
ncbi:Uncharacterised protein [Mycobacterium tuberculosis]|nr:Uncharacterised protein [Mycobacterium tuberculosis]